MIYGINKTFTMLFISTVALMLLSGLVRRLAITVAVLYVLSCVLLVGMSVFASAQANRQAYGKPFIWLRRRENRGFDSSVIDITAALFLLVFAAAYVAVAFGYIHTI